MEQKNQTNQSSIPLSVSACFIVEAKKPQAH